VSAARVGAHHYPDGQGYWSAFGKTDDEGRFRLSNCEADVPMHLTVMQPDTDIEVLRLAGIVPGEHEQRFTLPAPTAVHVRGIVLDDAGAPLPNVDMFVFGRDQRVALETNRADATFAFGPFPAGEYRLYMRREGFAPLRVPFHPIADGDTWDTGPLRMQRGGSMRATFVGDGAFADRSIEVTFPDGEYAWGNTSENGTAIVGPLAAGDYLLHVDGDDTICQIVPFTIRDGADTVLDVPVRTGTPTTLTFTTPASVPAPLAIHVTITDTATGTRRLHRRIWNRDGLVLRTMLPAGRFRIEARGPNKMQKELSCTVDLDVGTQPATPTFELRPRD
jgi:hypothetical protein